MNPCSRQAFLPFRALTLGTLIALGAISALSAQAGEMPKRKAGLWEIKVDMEGMPNMGPMQQCVGKDTDNLMQQKGHEKCSVMDFEQSGDTMNAHFVCQVEASTATTDASFVGSLDSGYKGTMKTRFDPPMHGMREANMTQEARWLGPCKPGQKPGQTIMPNMNNLNLNEMMNDPKIKELMKRQK